MYIHMHCLDMHIYIHMHTWTGCFLCVSQMVPSLAEEEEDPEASEAVRSLLPEG